MKWWNNVMLPLCISLVSTKNQTPLHSSSRIGLRPHALILFQNLFSFSRCKLIYHVLCLQASRIRPWAINPHDSFSLYSFYKLNYLLYTIIHIYVNWVFITTIQLCILCRIFLVIVLIILRKCLIVLRNVINKLNLL